MLQEKISYEYDFPLNIVFAELTEYPLHYHQDVEFVVVLQGEIEIKNGCSSYTMHEGGIYTNNGHEVHGIYSTGSKEATLAIIQLNTAYFSQHFPYLQKSSYTTYSNKESDPRFDKLREMILGILSTYLRKGIDYKQQCIDEAIELIDFLNRNFNLFSVDEGILVSPLYDNLILIERMSRIIPYIYEHHAEKIVLEDLAEIEHLSIYYISHMIKTCTGLSFREFLALARAEYSEMMLLETDKKIHAIAKATGFSTTSYYEKFFKRWFGISPEEHRQKYTCMIKGPLRPLQLTPVTVNTALSMVQKGLSMLQQKSYAMPVRQLTLYIRINAQERTLARLSRNLEINLTSKDYYKMGNNIFNIFNQLKCSKANLQPDSRDNISLIKEEFQKHDITLNVKSAYNLEAPAIYGLDSIANLVHIYRQNLLSSSPVEVKLMDSGDEKIPLRGDSGLLTSSGLFKPAYYAYLLLSKLQGELIAYDNHYAAVRTGSSYIISVFNYNSNTSRICSSVTSISEVQEALNNFKDELEMNMTLTNITGNYSVKKFSYNNTETLFEYFSRLDFPDRYSSDMDFDLNYYTVPKTDVFTVDVNGSLSLNFSVMGTGLQIAVIEMI